MEKNPAAELAKSLKGRLKGRIHTDSLTRQLYSTDASMFQVRPDAVLIPKVMEDVHLAMEQAQLLELPVVSRGSGTSVSGQAIGPGLVIDLSTHLKGVIETNLEERWIKVQPGIIQDDLNRLLLPKGFMLGPDTSTSNRATLGGMAGNNSAGARSILYGKMVDHVLEVDTILADGHEMLFKHLSPGELAQKLKLDGAEGHIYREVNRVVQANRAGIEARYPKIKRRVSGYNLDELLHSTGINLASLLVGSEGSLGLISALKMNIVPAPKHNGLLIIHFKSFIEAIEANGAVMEHQPVSSEVIDDTIINEALKSPMLAGKLDFLEGVPGGLLVVEFFGKEPAEVEDKLDKLTQDLKRKKHGYAWVKAIPQPLQNQVWNLRKLGLGVIMGTRVEAKPVAFVEDTAVDPLKLAPYMRDFKQLMDRHKAAVGFYGHASAGCVHIRPFLDLRQEKDKKRMMAMFDEVAGLVAQYGGAMSGEHGDGYARSWLNQRLFGDQLYTAFVEIKKAFDPDNRMNPGKVVNGPQPTENLRYLPRVNELESPISFARDGGLGFALEMCNGNGQCRKMDGTMCPSFQATGLDRHSTRGRANALRAFIQGQMDLKGLTSKEMYEVMDLCLQCKGCKTECPSLVDMAKMKQAFLFAYHKKNGIPLRTRMFANAEASAKLGSFFAPFSNWAMLGGPARWLVNMMGVAPQRKLPPYVRGRFSKWFRRRKGQPGPDERPPVVLFHDTYMEYSYPHLGKSAVEILEHAGYRVILPNKKCCGRPFISKGMLGKARLNALHNIQELAPYARQGVPIVGVEPSCVMTLKDDYLDLVGGPDAQAVAAQTYTMDSFIEKLMAEGRLRFAKPQGDTPALLHGHCMQKSLEGTQNSMKVLSGLPGVKPQLIPSGCCGVAGSFGYEKEHYALSLQIGELKLLPAVRKAPANALIVANGLSCRQQIGHATEKKGRHLVEVVAERLEK